MHYRLTAAVMSAMGRNRTAGLGGKLPFRRIARMVEEDVSTKGHEIMLWRLDLPLNPAHRGIPRVRRL